MEPFLPQSADDDIEFEVHGLRRGQRSPADRAHVGARALRWCAVAIALLAVVGGALVTFGGDADALGPYNSSDYQWGRYLSMLAQPLGFAALVLAASYLLALHATRLETEQAERQAVERPEPAAELSGR